MRMMMGLDRPTSGTVTVNGKPYRQHRAPVPEVATLLEASAVHPAAAPAHTMTTPTHRTLVSPEWGTGCPVDGRAGCGATTVVVPETGRLVRSRRLAG